MKKKIKTIKYNLKKCIFQILICFNVLYRRYIRMTMIVIGHAQTFELILKKVLGSVREEEF